MTPTLTFNPSQYYDLYRPSRCELRLYLTHKDIKPSQPGAFELVLARLGHKHEMNHLASFPDSLKLTGAPAERTADALRSGTRVVYQGALKASVRMQGTTLDVSGVPDFMIRTDGGYIIRDCKLARSAGEADHPEIARQLQTYGLLYERTTGTRPVRLEVLTGDGALDVLDYAGENAVIASLHNIMNVISLPEEPYAPVGWTKCGGCGYREYCMTRAGKNRDIALVYDLDQNLAVHLRGMGVSTLDDLVTRFDEQGLSEVKRPWGAREQKVGKKAASILLQARAMLDNREIVIGKPALPVSMNYVMFDLEGLPPQLDELDKIYLWGMKVCGERPGAFHCSLAEPGAGGDKAGWERFLTLASDIFLDYGDIPFVHWHHYERTKINAYIERYGDRDGIAERVLSQLVDLLPITRAAVVLPEPSYSLKVVEKHVGFQRSQDEYGGEWSIAKYIEAVETEDEGKRRSLMNEIVKYNEEDLQATWAVFEWLRRLNV